MRYKLIKDDKIILIGSYPDNQVGLDQMFELFDKCHDSDCSVELIHDLNNENEDFWRGYMMAVNDCDEEVPETAEYYRGFNEGYGMGLFDSVPDDDLKQSYDDGVSDGYIEGYAKGYVEGSTDDVYEAYERGHKEGIDLIMTMNSGRDF